MRITGEVFIYGFIATAISYIFIFPWIRKRWPLQSKVLAVVLAIAAFLAIQLYEYFTREKLSDVIQRRIGDTICWRYTWEACPDDVRARRLQYDEAVRRQVEEDKLRAERDRETAREELENVARQKDERLEESRRAFTHRLIDISRRQIVDLDRAIADVERRIVRMQAPRYDGPGDLPLLQGLLAWLKDSRRYEEELLRNLRVSAESRAAK